MDMELLLREQLQAEILSWYQRVGRKLPWRETADPYRIMVSELMLQQTQASRVVPKYETWLDQFPDTESLATAPTAQIIQAWAGLGYNRRALYLQKTAQSVQAIGVFPATYQELVALPGIGPYTAAAICSFAYNQDVPLVDTNVKRIYQLLIFGDQVLPTEKQVLEIAAQFLPHGQSRVWHNALMDIGTILAKERGAKAQQQKLVELFPSLQSYDLPLVSDQPLKRPKQSPFRNSNRYWRGRILDLLRTHHQLTIIELKKILTFPEATICTVEGVVNSLVKDGLAACQNGIVSLPR